MTPAATDWREAARGIPVWDGALALFDRVQGWQAGRVLDTADMLVRDRGMLVRWREGDVIPDLSDPDTRAAYVPRLALARGAPEAAARRGWLIDMPTRHLGDWEPGTLSIGMEWGCSLHLPPEVRPAAPDLDLLVLALAWPADKRVTG